MAEPATTTAPRRSLLDRINPATRIALAVVLSLPLLLTLDWVSAAVALVLELLVALACGFGAWRILRTLAPLFVIAPMGAVGMLLYGQPGGQVHWHWGPATISDNSLRLALALVLRVPLQQTHS